MRRPVTRELSGKIAPLAAGLLGMAVVWPQAAAEESFLGTMIRATVKVVNPGSTASGFLVELPTGSWALVSAAHVFNSMRGEQCTVVLHRRDEEGKIVKNPQVLTVRREGKPLWQRHPTADVAVLPVDFGPEANLGALPFDCLAKTENLEEILEPGTLVRALGFPHANIFKGNPEEFGVARLGCVASYPLLPPSERATFLVDMNSFEGDSGGPVFVVQEGRNAESADAPAHLRGWVVGLISGQHFVDEEYKLIYQTGKFRHRMGLAIVVPSPFIREVLEKLAAPTQAPPQG